MHLYLQLYIDCLKFVIMVAACAILYFVQFYDLGSIKFPLFQLLHIFLLV